MKNLYYVIIIFLVCLILHESCLKYITIKEGLTEKDSKLWKNNHHNTLYLDKKISDLEELKYIRKNHPSLLGNRVNDKSYTIADVIKYFKSGVDDNTKQLESIAMRLATAIPDPETTKITGTN